MKAFFGKLLFVLAIVGIIALGNVLIPAPSNESSTAAVEKTTDDEPAADSATEAAEPAAEPEEYTEEPTE